MEWNEVDLVQEFTVEGQCSKIKVRSCRITWDNLQVPQVELTLSELQEMATRQQQQIEAQQQMLMAKVTAAAKQPLRTAPPVVVEICAKSKDPCYFSSCDA
ncbi:apoptosis-stimulating of p53 protein 1-like [Poecilia latipinna]|uniref:apoptosis-stimulating of p53 protein 1-like n=1 Tax=Poecilia latipinna TaxID=48699 RepID=UPI00072E64B6|nr:PREDICTED: apoptosis-stimulating of p53 protein 1-like isoform X2 [Poecilia mexicana]XP_014879100.1 PREDICTED: apoptosis-stimulating of p53 protein 1-like [Poecilia latipinna]